MTGELPAWVGPLVAFVVAVVGASGLIIVRKIRGPVAIQDLWAENRALRADMTAIEAKVDTLIAGRETQLAVNRIMGDGFDALSQYVGRTTERGKRPSYTPTEQTAIERARALRSDSDLWTTITKTKENK